MENIGSFALIAAFALCVYALVAALAGRWTGRPVLEASAARAVRAMWFCVTAAILCLWAMLIQDNFANGYVAGHSNRAMPLIYKFTALWSGQEGSLLFWSWLLSTYSMAAVWLNRRHLPSIQPYVIASLMFVQGFFLLLNNFVASPFLMLAQRGPGGHVPFIPADGQGMNPVLQYPAMAIHPPMLYLGYVGFAVPFAFAMASLITRAPGDAWIKVTRRWTMVAWLFLTAGIALGSAWAYAVLGWGGHWGWDPVENASFMPWLMGTAFLHSVMMQEKKGMMKIWNMVLIFATFFLCIFGTFLTRSGVVQSVHAFAQSSIGTWFTSFLVIGIAFSIWMVLERLDYLKPETKLESVVSRESSFLFNNLMLLTACFAILWGTLFPVLSEAVTGNKITVGPPFFNKVNVPIGLGLLFLTGVGPLIAWRRSSLASLQKSLFVPAVCGVIFGAICFALGGRGFYPMVAYILAGFVGATIFIEFYKGARAIQRRTQLAFASAVVQLTMRNTRRYGGYVVHLGIVLVFIGLSGSAFQIQKQVELKNGDSFQIKNYKLTLTGLEDADTANYTAQRAYLEVQKDGAALGTMLPERRVYRASEQPSSEVSIRRRLNEDLYVVLAAGNPDGSAVLQAFVNPLENWIWIGVLVTLFGTGLCLVPNRAAEQSTPRARPATVKVGQKDEVLA